MKRGTIIISRPECYEVSVLRVPEGGGGREWSRDAAKTGMECSGAEAGVRVCDAARL